MELLPLSPLPYPTTCLLSVALAVLTQILRTQSREGQQLARMHVLTLMRKAGYGTEGGHPAGSGSLWLPHITRSCQLWIDN